MKGATGKAALAFSVAIAASCGQAGGARSAAEGSPIDLDPGTWRSEISLVETRGMPEWMAGSQDMLDRMSERDRCMPVEAARNAALHDTLTRGPWRGGDCVFSRTSVTDAGVDIVMRCVGISEAHLLDTTVKGTASARKTVLVIENKSRNPRTGGEMYEKYRVVSTWHAAACKKREQPPVD